MNRMEFFRRLEYLLRELPASEKMDALAYYNDYFDEAGVENEQRVMQELGSPEAVAQNILADYRQQNGGNYSDYGSPKEGQNKEAYGQYGAGATQQSYGYQEQNVYNTYQQAQSTQKQPEKKKLSTGMVVLIVVIAILTFPIWIGVVAGLFGAIVGVLGALFGVVVAIGGSAIGVLVGSIACIVAGVFATVAIPVEGFAMIAVGALLFAVGVLLLLLFVLIAFEWLPLLIKSIIKAVKGLKHRKEGGNEI